MTAIAKLRSVIKTIHLTYLDARGRCDGQLRIDTVKTFEPYTKMLVRFEIVCKPDETPEEVLCRVASDILRKL